MTYQSPHHYCLTAPHIKGELYRATEDQAAELYTFLLAEAAEQGHDPEAVTLLEPTEPIPEGHVLLGGQFVSEGERVPAVYGLDFPDWLLEDGDRLEKVITLTDQVGNFMGQWAYKMTARYPSTFTVYVHELNALLWILYHASSGNDPAIDAQKQRVQQAQEAYLSDGKQVEVTLQLTQIKAGDHWSVKIISGEMEFNDYSAIGLDDDFETQIKHMRKWCSGRRYLVKNHRAIMTDQTIAEEKGMKFDHAVLAALDEQLTYGV